MGEVIPTLSAAQIDALRWIDRFPCTESEWTENGKPAKRGPAHWTAIRLSGKRGSILISGADWEAVHGCYEVNSDNIHVTMWRLTDVGRAAIAKAEGSSHG